MMASADVKSSQTDSQDSIKLAPGFESLQVINRMPNERLSKEPLVNVIGLVKDYLPPIKTRGKDYKCTTTIFDIETQDEDEYGRIGTVVNIFYSHPERMPKISGPGDALLIRKIKAYMRNGMVMLMCNKQTEFNVFAASAIPQWPITSLAELSNASFTPQKRLTELEAAYIVWLKAFAKSESLPTAAEFQQAQSTVSSTRQRYSMLKDLKADNFYDLIVEVRHIYEQDGRMTILVTDYTEHPLFYEYKMEGLGADAAQDGDEYGYMKKFKKPKQQDGGWQGPYGSMTLQVTAFDYHVDNMKDVNISDWVLLKNVKAHIAKAGRLEGVMHGETGAFAGRVNIVKMKPSDDAATEQPNFYEAVQRSSDYWKKLRNQEAQSLTNVEEGATSKRKLDNVATKNNSRKKRKEQRALAERVAASEDQAKSQALGLNANIKCIAGSREAASFARVLGRDQCDIKAAESTLAAPFQNLKYRVNVRVVDYFPHKLEHFTVGRKKSIYDMLKDHDPEDADDTECEGTCDEMAWQWRFSLYVEEYRHKGSDPHRLWLHVDNASAQYLLQQDAACLLHNRKALRELREKLFICWGDLEEKKSEFLRTKAAKTLLWASTHEERDEDSDDDSSDDGSTEAQTKQIKHNALKDAPPDSDDENPHIVRKTKQPAGRPALKNKSNNNEDSSVAVEDDPKAIRKLKIEDAQALWRKKIESLDVHNKGFGACVQQYGIGVIEEDPALADAGDGIRWQRMFGLFGTTIHIPSPTLSG